MMNTLVFDVVYRVMSYPAVSGFTVFLAEWLPYLLLGFAVVYEFFIRDTGGTLRSLTRVFTPATVAVVIAKTIKLLFHAPRPFAMLNITPLVSVSDPFGSFPSNHTTFFFALGMSMYFCNKKIGALFLLGALLVAFARIGSGVHWPVDILAGTLLGLTVSYIFEKFLLRFIWKDHVPSC